MTIVVASVPEGHVYVRHLSSAADESEVVRLPDPDPGGSDRLAGAVWWPPRMLDPQWAASADFDVFHVHFGFDACTPEQLIELVAVLRARNKPLVLTVHDLRNPHHESPEYHQAHLDVLVPAADALITLTLGAAQVIEERWGRHALVLPHPHVVELEEASRLRRARATDSRPFRIGLHVKSLRASMDPERILPTLVETVAELPDAVLQVDGHRDILEAGGDRFDDALAGCLTRWADEGLLDLRVHDYFSDEQLWAYLASLDVSVLPYRFGTHSGWLEACRDLGTTVVAPTCGFYDEQGPVLSYVHDERMFDARSLAGALHRAYRDRPDLSADLSKRRAQRQRLAEAHEALYRGLLRARRGHERCASA